MKESQNMSENKNSWPGVLLSSSDENAQRIYNTNWLDNQMGPIENWSPSFITILTTSIASRFPALMLWGENFITFYNAGYASILGDKQTWALGKPLQEVWPEAWESLYGMLKGVIATGNGSWAEDQIYYLHRNGFPEESYFTFSFARIIDERGGFGGILCTAIETTQKVIAERRLKTLRELGNRVGVKLTIADVCIESLEVMRQLPRDIPFAVLRMILPDGLTAEVRSSYGILTPTRSLSIDSAGNNPILGRIFESGEPEFIDVIPDDESLMHSEMGLDPVKTAFVLPIKLSLKGSVCGFLTVGLSPHLPFDESYRSFLDLLAFQISAGIASAKGQEDARIKEQELAKLDQLKTTFFSNVSHEFRTPLTLLLGPLEDAIVEAHGLDITLDRQTFDSVYRNALRLLKLVNSLLDFTRMEAGKVEASFQPVDLKEFTSGLASQFRHVMEKGNLHYEVELDEISEPIFVDCEMWEKIVLNLLSNAFKFTLNGSVKVFLKEFSDRVELTIQDTGIGISKEELPKIFDRFHRVEGAISRTFEGSGIGLALVKAMIRVHEGKITIDSGFEIGTTIKVNLLKGFAHLPVSQLKAQSLYVENGKLPILVEEASRWLPEYHMFNETKDRSTILVVDDNADMRDYLERKLIPHYNMLSASNGREALNVIQYRMPDLIISDIMMPEMGGFELLRNLKSHDKTAHLPVIFLSARAGNEATIEGLEAGADDYLVKPFSSKELLARVNTQLSVVRLRSDLVNEQKALQARDEFLSIASHELNTPLTPLKLQVQSLNWFIEQGTLSSLSPERLKVMVNVLDRQIDKIANLIRDLMDVTRISQGTLVLDKQKIDLNTIVSTVLDEYKQEIIQAKCTLEIDLKAHVLSFCDRDRIEQVVTNLLTNAIKYAAGTLITIATFVRENQAVISVSDKGPGISADNLGKIFNRYERIDVSSHFGGLGLGLYISKQIIDAHNGSIKVESTLDEGTTFYLELPILIKD